MDLRKIISKSGSNAPSKNKKRLSDMHIRWLSLVADPANEKGLVFKSGDSPAPETLKTIIIRKSTDEKHLLYMTVFEPEMEDSQNEIASAEEIEKACHRFMAEYRQEMVDTEHDQYQNRSIVVESFIKYGSHPDFTETKDGAWCVVVKVRDTELWEKVKSGQINGISMYGDAIKEEITKSADTVSDDEKGLIRKIYEKLFKSGENEMDKEVKDKFEKLDADLAEIRKSKADADKANEDLKKEKEALEKSNGEMKAKVEDLEKSNGELKAEIEEIKKSGRLTKKKEGAGDGKPEDDDDEDYKGAF